MTERNIISLLYYYLFAQDNTLFHFLQEIMLANMKTAFYTHEKNIF